MAVISKIRRYSAIAIGFIAFSVFAFVLSDLLGQGGIFNALGTSRQYAGTMAGEWISAQDFEKAVKNETAGTQTPETQGREIVWNAMLFDKIFLPECQYLGIDVTNREIVEMIQGDSIFIHPQIRQAFTDEKTKQFDKNRVIERLKQASKSMQEQYVWANYEKGLRKERMRTKYENLMRISTYVTKAEAEREHQAQNAKAEVKYVHIPFTSISDSTIVKQVKDADMQDYLNKNPNKFKAQESRSLEYIAIDIKPSKDDSVKFTTELRELAKEFGKSQDDSTFAKSKSDIPEEYKFKSPKELPAELFRKYPSLVKGAVYGPILDGKTYKVIKVSDTKKDSTNYLARASHILFKADKSANEETKAKARKEGEEILAKIKAGENFEEMAKKYGTDATAPNGGDLGWFGKGNMVKPFEDAVFNAGEGLINNLVVTDFGYHILKVTHAKTNIQYKIATVSRNLEPSDEAMERVLAEVRSIKEKNKSLTELRAFVKKNTKYVLQKAEKLQPQSTTLNAIQNAREAIRWAFGEANVGDLSEPIEFKDQNIYIIAAVSAKTEKNEVTLDAFREELKNEILKQIKTKAITAKLDLKAKTMDDIAKKYGKEALTGEAKEVTLNKNDLQSFGFNPITVGKAMGLKAGARSGLIVDDSGIFIVEMVKTAPAPPVADYTQYKNTLKQSKAGAASFFVQEAVKKYRKVEDLRYKIY